MMNDLDDLYFEIDPTNKIILNPPKRLEHNWGNISGLIYLPEDKLYDLSWAGYKNIGFLKLSKENANSIEKFKSNLDILNIIKILYKNFVSNTRYIKECGIITIDSKYSLQLSDRCKLLITMKYLECLSNNDLIFDWKTNSGYIKFDSKNFIKFYSFVQNYIQKLFDIERIVFENIENCKTILDVMETDLSLNCNSNITL